MKRLFTLLCTIMILCTAICTCAEASDFDDLAQELSNIGMFRGTGDSFELDREPTRGEAAIMLVRLYGAEEQALADYASGIITHPFTDVPDWTSPYVAWLYSNNMTKGMSDTTFGSAEICTALNYATFLLRALGYQDGVDFAYVDALSFAQELGFYDEELFAGPFLRDDLAAMTYQALGTNVKSGDTYLLAQLIANGAINTEAAHSLSEKMNVWNTFFNEMNFEVNAYECDNTLVSKAAYTITEAGVSETINTDTTTSVHIAQIGFDENIQYACLTTTEYLGISNISALYLKDGWFYSASYFGSIPLSLEKYPATPELIAEESVTSSPTTQEGSLFFVIDNITMENKNGNTVYTMITDEADLLSSFTDALGDLEPESMGEIVSMKVENIKYIYTFNADGKLQSVNTSLSYHIELVSYETGEPSYLHMELIYDLTTVYTAWNEDVEITFPDFSDYIEVSEEQLEDQFDD